MYVAHTHSSFFIHAVIVNVDKLLGVSARLIHVCPEVLLIGGNISLLSVNCMK